MSEDTTNKESVKEPQEEKIHTGIVKWFDENKNFGFLLSAEDKEIFFHRRHIQNFKFANLMEGDKVEYVLFETNKGVQAKSVRKLGDEQRRPDRGKSMSKKYFEQLVQRRMHIISKIVGGKTAIGFLNKNRIYDILFEIGGGDIIELKKIGIKYLFEKDRQLYISQMLDWDLDTKSKKAPIPEKVIDRFRIDNAKFNDASKDNREVLVVLNEGEKFKGTISWATKYEFLLRVHNLASVLIFRHAVVDVQYLDIIPRRERRPSQGRNGGGGYSGRPRGGGGYGGGSGGGQGNRGGDVSKRPSRTSGVRRRIYRPGDEGEGNK